MDSTIKVDPDKIKKCNKCGIIKRKEEFYFHPYTSDRLQCRCKKCIKDAALKRYYTKIRKVGLA